QRRDLARAIRGAAPRQRAGPLPGLLSPARAGVALRRPPSAGAQAQARRALHALDREQWTRWLLHGDCAHHRAGQGIERTDRRLESMKEAQAHTLRLLKPGASCAEIAASHDEYMRGRALPPELRLYCHGQGYDLVERPLVRCDETMTIEEHMNFAVRPGYETPSIFAVICDNYLIESDGPGACLHKTPKQVFEV